VLVTTSDVLAKAGLGALALAVVTVVLLIFGVVIGTSAGFVAAALVLIFFVSTWMVMPLVLLHRSSNPQTLEKASQES